MISVFFSLSSYETNLSIPSSNKNSFNENSPERTVARTRFVVWKRIGQLKYPGTRMTIPQRWKREVSPPQKAIDRQCSYKCCESPAYAKNKYLLSYLQMRFFFMPSVFLKYPENSPPTNGDTEFLIAVLC